MAIGEEVEMVMNFSRKKSRRRLRAVKAARCGRTFLLDGQLNVILAQAARNLTSTRAVEAAQAP